MRLDHLSIQVTAEDMEAARLMGATGPELMEAAIHTALDRMGEPRTGRTVTLKPGCFYVDMEEE